MAGPELTSDTSINPYVEVFFDPADLDPATVRLRVYRFSDNRTWLVRGGVDIATGVAVLDFEIPFGVEATYRAEQFDVDDLSLGFTDISTITLDVSDTWVHNPLDPTLAVNLGAHPLEASTTSKNVRPTVGEVVYTEGSTVGHWVGTRRRGVERMPFALVVEDTDQVDQLQYMLGSYEVQQVGVLCIRTPGPSRLPRTFFAAVEEPDEGDSDVAWGGVRTVFTFTATEVRPPFPGLVTPLLTYDDIDAFGDYDVQDATWATYTDRDRAYGLAGLAG